MPQSFCANCELLPLRKLLSHLARFNGAGQARAPRGSEPVSVKAARRLQLGGSQMELVEEVEMALALSQISDSSFSVLI